MGKGLHGIIRFRRHQVDEARRSLGLLLNMAADMERQAAALEKEIVEEQRAASEKPEEAGFTYGRYALRAIHRRSLIARARAEVEQRIAVAQESVRLEFREMKVFEIAQENRDTTEQAEALRTEQALLDELGLQRHAKSR